MKYEKIKVKILVKNEQDIRDLLVFNLQKNGFSSGGR